MREILFCGKRVDDGEWVMGQVVIRPDHDNGCEKYFICETKHLFICCLNKMPCTYEVDPSTVGQYTGLKDRNGDRIFEGDIVQIWWLGDESDPPVKYKAVVEFGNPNCEFDWGYQLRPLDYIPYNLDILLWVEDENDLAFCEVIGNVHDNPELLEANDDVPV